MARILKASDLLHVKRYGNYRAWLDAIVLQRWFHKANWQTTGTAARAEIWRGKWVAICPDCPESVIYEPGEPFYCPNCENVLNGGFARPVSMPVQSRAELERLLCYRHNPDNRNWLYGESVRDIQTENITHGVRI